jgi:hypothetical protein
MHKPNKLYSLRNIPTFISFYISLRLFSLFICGHHKALRLKIQE